MTPNDHRRQALTALGRELTPEAVLGSEALWMEEAARATAPRAEAVHRDLAYGPHERHRLDLFLPHGGHPRAPVFLFVHGGGFTGGDKQRPGSYLYDNIGHWAASRGWAGVNMNYRLAPGHTWPSAADDIALAIQWVGTRAAAYGIAADRLILAGHSAGAAHAASHVARQDQQAGLCAAVLLSGIYDVPAMAGRPSVQAYYGTDPARHAAQSTLDGLARCDVPLFIGVAGEDPDGFHAQALALLRRIERERGRLPAFCVLSGHNHFTQAFHIGGGDTRLANLLEAFVEDSLARAAGEEPLA